LYSSAPPSSSQFTLSETKVTHFYAITGIPRSAISCGKLRDSNPSLLCFYYLYSICPLPSCQLNHRRLVFRNEWPAFLSWPNRIP